MSAIEQWLSKVPQLPGLSLLSPKASLRVGEVEKSGYLAAQDLAYQAALEISRQLREGWTETQAAELLNTYLQDCGVRSFFHRAFVWFGERTKFEGVRNYVQYGPSDRILREGEVFILDVAPIVNGYICDIGYTSSLGENPRLYQAKQFLGELHTEIPRLFETQTSGKGICEQVDRRIQERGYENVHAKYPFSVLGHRVHRSVESLGQLGLLGFGWQSYWEFLSRGLFGQLLNSEYRGNLDGLWAIEPHIGDSSGFGAKFEQILVVQDGKASWLAEGDLP